MNNELLPTDMYIPDEPEKAWAGLAEANTAARMKRLDLCYYVHLQEVARGKSGWLERTMKRLNIPEAEVKQAKMVISDNVKVFRLFRMPTEYGGLGYTREDLGRVSFRKLRVIAQNKDWASQNKTRIPQILDELPSEEAIREMIAKESGKTLRSGTEDHDRVAFVFSSQNGATVREILAAAYRRREMRGEPVPETGLDGKKLSREYRDGIVLLEAMCDWMLGDSGLVDDNGPIPNMQFLAGGAYGPQDEAPTEEPHVQPTEGEQAA